MIAGSCRHRKTGNIWVLLLPVGEPSLRRKKPIRRRMAVLFVRRIVIKDNLLRLLIPSFRYRYNCKRLSNPVNKRDEIISTCSYSLLMQGVKVWISYRFVCRFKCGKHHYKAHCRNRSLLLTNDKTTLGKAGHNVFVARENSFRGRMKHQKFKS